MNTSNKRVTKSFPINTYTDLERQIHEDLLDQHPEWVEADGNCPKCDEHEARLKELLDALAPTGSQSSSSLSAQTVHFDRQTKSAGSDRAMPNH